MDEHKNIINEMKQKAERKQLEASITIAVGIAVAFLLIYIITHNKTPNTNIVIIPFFVCPIAYTILGVAKFFESENLLRSMNITKYNSFSEGKKFKIVKNKIEKANKTAFNIYLFSFFTFFFGLLAVADYYAIINGKIDLFLVTLIFWFVGIFFLVKKGTQK